MTPPAVSAEADLLLHRCKMLTFIAEMLDGSPNGYDGVAYTSDQAKGLA